MRTREREGDEEMRRRGDGEGIERRSTPRHETQQDKTRHSRGGRQRNVMQVGVRVLVLQGPHGQMRKKNDLREALAENSQSSPQSQSFYRTPHSEVGQKLCL